MTDLIPYVSIAASDSYDIEASQEAGVQVTDNALLWTMGGHTFPSRVGLPYGSSSHGGKRHVDLPATSNQAS